MGSKDLMISFAENSFALLSLTGESHPRTSLENLALIAGSVWVLMKPFDYREVIRRRTQ